MCQLRLNDLTVFRLAPIDLPQGHGATKVVPKRSSAIPLLWGLKVAECRDGHAGQENTVEPTELQISPEKVCFVVIKAREFDVKDAVTEPDPGSNPSDDQMVAVLEDHADDPVVEELSSFIGAMSEDEQIDLVAMAWLGRGDYTADDSPSVREEAARAHNQNTAAYLLGMPMLGDFLEEGLSLLGYSCEPFEMNRL